MSISYENNQIINRVHKKVYASSKWGSSLLDIIIADLTSNHEMGLYYNEGPVFKQLKLDNQWTMNNAQNSVSFQVADYRVDGEQTQQADEQAQLNRGVRYLENCVVDKEAIRCSIQICIITNKIEQILTKMLTKESLLQLFIHARETGQNCIYKHSTIQSFPNSNVFSLETSNVECTQQYHQSNKQNSKMTPKSWLKSSKASQKMMELLIVKKHISISQNTEIGAKRITIIHRLFIVNQKYLQNPLIKIYLQKSHFVLDARGETFRPQTGVENKANQQDQNVNTPNRPRKTSLYNKLFNHKSFFDKDCVIYNRGEFLSTKQVKSEVCQFKHSFHKIEERIAKDYMRKLNDILVEDKRKSCNTQKDYRI